MKLRQIAATNIKGRTFTLPLAAANLLVGVNMSGKTAVLDAIRLALLGSLPHLDKTNAGIFSLSGGTAMRVEVTLDDGRQIERAWMAKPDGGITKNERQSHGIEPVPLVMLDAGEYLGKSERERLEMIFSLMNLGDTPIQMRRQQIRERLEAAHNGRTIEALGDAGEMPNENFQRWLERLIEFVAQEKRNEDATAKKMNATTQSLAHLQLEDEPKETPESIETELAAARKVLESKRLARSELEAQLKAHATNAQRRLSLMQTNEKLRPDALQVAELERLVTELRAALGKLGGEDEPPLKWFWEKVAEADGKRLAAEQGIKSQNAAINAHDAEFAQIMAHKKCPTCSADKPTWKTNAKKNYTEKRKQLDTEHDSLVAAHEQAVTEAAEARKQANEAEERAKTADDLRDKIHDGEIALARCRSAASQIESNEKELAVIAQSSGSVADEEKRQTAACNADAEYEDARNEVERLETKRQIVADALADRKQLQTAAQKRDQAKADSEFLKQGLKILEEVRNNYMMTGFKPLLDIANHFATGVLPTPLEYRGGEIGRVEKHRWISWRTFSGAETDITRAAISAALGASSSVRIVIVDELGRMDRISKARFIRNVLAALPQDKEHAGLIDQFIGADVEASVYEEINADALAQQQPKPLQILPISA